MNDIQTLLKKGISFHQEGRFSEAEKIYENILIIRPNHPDALHLSGVIAHQQGKNECAIRLIKEAIRNHPNNPFFYNSLGASLAQLGRPKEAAACYEKSMQIKPDYAEAAYNLGSVFLFSGRPSQAVPLYQKAIQLKPDYVEAYNNLAVAHIETENVEKAIYCCQKALSIRPNHPEALNNLGNALSALGKSKDAIAYFQRAIELAPNNPEVHYNMGNSLHDAGQPEHALKCYQTALQLKGTYGEALNNMGIVLRELGKVNASISCYQKAIQARPKDPEAYHNMGNAFKDLQRLDEALAWYNKAIELNPDVAEPYINLGTVLEDQGRPDEAIAFFNKALSINPENEKAYSHMVHRLMHECSWQELGNYHQKLDELTANSLVQGKKPDEMPFLNLARRADPALNYNVARAWSNEISRRVSGIKKYFDPGGLDNVPKGAKKEKIKIAYLSNNFKNHPTSHLIQGLFSLHDRDEFEIFAVSYGEDDHSAYRKRIQEECDHFFDIREASHIEASDLINRHHIDILVDLVGYMKGNRLAIPALRPAPIQVRWLGLAGSTGADFFDYLITDPMVTPKEETPDYSETFVYMPHCYQINDHRQKISEKTWNRSELGLPETGMVFCSFSSRYKIDPVMFDCWMRILIKIPDSVLWLLGGSAIAESNLKQAAADRGVESNRIVFANRMAKEDHLARLKLADIALDTRIVNGAATTSDALWAGVPVITLKGRHFASRMSASILTAMDLPDLIATGMRQYEALAVRLAEDKRSLKHLKQRLAINRIKAPLFDTKRFVGNLEGAYRKMLDYYPDKPKAPIRVSEGVNRLQGKE